MLHLKMPAEIWMKIAKNLFWDHLNLDAVKSQAIANLMFSWTWASGYGWRGRVQRYLKAKNIAWEQKDLKGLAAKLNELTDKQGEQKISDEMFEQYRQFYKSLNQPVYIKGWLNRLEDLKKYSDTFITFVKKNEGSIGGILLFGLGTATVLYFVTRK